MKKFLCIFYAIMLVFTILAACTSDGGANAAATDIPPVSETIADNFNPNL